MKEGYLPHKAMVNIIIDIISILCAIVTLLTYGKIWRSWRVRLQLWNFRRDCSEWKDKSTYQKASNSGSIPE